MERADFLRDWYAAARDLIERLFPERQLVFRTEGRVNFFRLGSGAQFGAAALAALALCWTAFSSYSYIFHSRIVAEKNAEIFNHRLAYSSLLKQVSDYQRSFTELSIKLDDSRNAMLELVERNAALQQNLKTVESQLRHTEDERARIVSVREDLQGKLNNIQSSMREMAGRNFELRDDLETVESDLQSVAQERNQALFESARMRRKIKGLETRLSELEETETEAVNRLAESAGGAIEDMERVIELTGLDPDALAKAAGGAKGQGGPFFAAKKNGAPASRLQGDLIGLDSRLRRWETLQDAIIRVPLAVPLDGYYVTSSYGKRRDPVNRKWAMHYGLDLGGTLKSPVRVTAPGVVTHAGWKGKYGKLVEIDHGAGIKTRYGHLHKVLVKKGQKVSFRDKIGLLGNTGRSTGAHLHYEVVFKGKTRDPMKFIKAGRYVFQEKETARKVSGRR